MNGLVRVDMSPINDRLGDRIELLANEMVPVILETERNEPPH